MQIIYYIQGFRAGQPCQLLLRGHEVEARMAADVLAQRYEGVLAWSQLQDYDEGYYGEPTVLIRAGQVPDMYAYEN